MRRRSLGITSFLALLATDLLVCDVKTVVWLKIGDPEFPLETLYSPKPALADARLPALTPTNDVIAGYAPGHSIGSGLDDAKNGFLDWLWLEESAGDRAKLAARHAKRRAYPSPKL